MLLQAMETRQLARESQQRLNGFMEQLRSSAAVDLSAKNLGDEGTQYVVEALAFNDRCATDPLAAAPQWQPLHMSRNVVCHL